MAQKRAQKAGRPGVAEARARRDDPLAAPKRRRPKQERSKATVEQILNAAVDILEAGGFEAVTMQTIADAAAINIATIYSYFPNKHHVLAHLARLRLDERLSLLEAAFSALVVRDDWIDGFCEVLEDLYRLRAGQAGMVALRQAMHASPPLGEIDQEGNRRAAGLVAGLLAARAGDDGSRAVQGRVIAEYVTATLDHLQRLEPEAQKATFDELARLTRGYLNDIANSSASPRP